MDYTTVKKEWQTPEHTKYGTIAELTAISPNKTSGGFDGIMVDGEAINIDTPELGS